MVPIRLKSREKEPSELDLQFSFHKFRKFRLQIAWLFACLLAVFAESSNRGFFMGIPVIFLGETIRIWSHGYLRKARQLATDGPYAYVRNPLYLGNFLIGFGFCLIIWHPMIVTSFVVGFYTVYWITVKGEEQRLAHKFGVQYAEYVKKVPRFIPHFSPYPNRSRALFRAHRIWGHGEHITILGILILLSVLYLRQEFYQQRNPITTESIVLIIFVFVLVGITALFMQLRRKARAAKTK